MGQEVEAQDAILARSQMVEALITSAFHYPTQVSASADGTPVRTLLADRRYERLDITGLTGLTEAQRAEMLALGAVDRGSTD